MKKRFFSSCLMLLFILMISGCAGAYNDYKEKNTGSVSLNVGQIAQSVLQANRSISREGDEKDFIEPWQCISSAVLKINVETKGDYKTSETKELSFNYAKYMGFVEDYSDEPVTSDKPVEEENYLETTFKDEVIELKIPVGKTISIDMTVDQELSWDENKLEQFYNQLLTEMENSGASEEEIDKFTFASFKESLDLQFNGEMGIRLKGTSGEITVHEGENPVTITLKEVPYNGGEEIERKYYLIHLQSQNAATLTYEEPISFEYMSIDEDGARLKAICYYYEPVGYFINEEKSDQDWKEDDFGNLYMDIYFDYNEEAKKEGLYQTVGLDNIENRYTITLYSAKNQTDSGIYMIANSDGLQVSYGEWKDISGTDAKIPSFEFTENLYLNDLNGLSFAEDNTLTYSDMSDGFRFKSANRKEIDFGKLEPFNGEITEYYQYYNIYLQEPGAETSVVYKEPVELPYIEDAYGAELKEFVYRNCNIFGWYYDNEGEWITNGNLIYKDVYFYYDESKIMELSYQSRGMTDEEESYLLSMYALKNNSGEGIYFIEKIDNENIGYSYGKWESTAAGASPLTSIEFTEELAYNFISDCIGFAPSSGNQNIQVFNGTSSFNFASTNDVTIKFESLVTATPVNGSGTINPVLPNQFTIAIASAEETYYLNKGTIDFKLTDADGQEIDVSNVFWEYEISHGKTTIPDNGTYYTYENPGSLELKNLPASGTYQINVFVTPANQDYENYEMANAVFNVTVDDKLLLEFDLSSCYVENEFTSDFQNLVDSHNAKIVLQGEINEEYGIFLAKLKAAIYHPENPDDPVYNLYDLDLSQVTTTNTDNEEQGYFSNCLALHSIIFPEDFTTVNNWSFNDCINLEKIELGTAVAIIGTSTFSGCTNLSSVVIPETAQLKVIDSSAFEGDTALTSLTLPASVIALGDKAIGRIESLTLLDENGTWWYIEDDELRNAWISWWENPDEADPPNENADGTLDGIDGIDPSWSLAEKILYAVNEKNCLLFCQK